MRRIIGITAGLALAFAACAPKDGNQYGPLTGPDGTTPPDTDEPGDTGVDTGDTGVDTAVDTGIDTGVDTALVDTADTADTADTEPPDINGTGYGVGDVVFDLTASNQSGGTWSLHDQYGKVTVLVFGDGYDSTFTYMADYLDDVEDAYGSDVAIAGALILGSGGYTATQSDAQAIASTYGMNTVLYINSVKDQLSWAGGSRPVTYIIGPTMTISRIEYGIVDQDDIEGWINGLL